MHQFVVLAIERGTGKTIWQTVVREELPHEAGHISASQASASPVTDGAHVWASFGSRGLYCLDKNGKDLVPANRRGWSVDAVARQIVAAQKARSRTVPGYVALLAGESEGRQRGVHTAVFGMS